MSQLQTQNATIPQIPDPSFLGQSTADQERAAFDALTHTPGFQLPTNFKSVEDYWNSIKNLQRLATQKAQEAAELRKQINTGGPVTTPATSLTDSLIPPSAPAPAPVAQPQIPVPSAPAAPAAPAPLSGVTPLQIQPAPPAPPGPTPLSEAEYNGFRDEVIRTGTLAEASRSALSARGYTATQIDDLVAGGKARIAEAMQKSVAIVGSKERLAEIFAWAGRVYTPEQLAQVNAGLANPQTSEIFLRGLSDHFTKANPPRAPEPPRMSQAVSVSNPGQMIDLPGYANLEEFRVDRNNPRYNTDPKFRDAVAMRLAKSPGLVSLPRPR